jgi:hypothetical protein
LSSEPARGGRPSGLELRRLEAKYWIDRSRRTALGRDLRAFMRPDVHSGPGGSYRVRSLYLDTPDFQAYHEKLAGVATRHKLRVRLYGDPAHAEGVRFEVKSRHQGFIHKLAFDVPRGRYPELLEALRRRRTPPADLLETSRAAREFFRIQRLLGMEPKLVVEYRREALERSELGRTRVNFDFELRASRDLDLFGSQCGARAVLGCGRSILEIKVDGRLPWWLHLLISKYDLQAEAISKYCYAVRSEARLSGLSRADEEFGAEESAFSFGPARERGAFQPAEA